MGARSPFARRVGHDLAASIPGRGRCAGWSRVRCDPDGHPRRRRDGCTAASVTSRPSLRRWRARWSRRARRPPRRAGAGEVAIVVGDEVNASGAIAEVVALAEAIAAPVHGAPLHSTAVFPPAHALWRGMLAPAAAAVRTTLARYQRVFVVGGQAFLVYPYTEGSPLPDGIDLLHLAPDSTVLARAHPTRLALIGDPKSTLTALLPLVRARVDDTAIADALAEASQQRTAEIERLEQTRATGTRRRRSTRWPLVMRSYAHCRRARRSSTKPSRRVCTCAASITTRSTPATSSAREASRMGHARGVWGVARSRRRAGAVRRW